MPKWQNWYGGPCPVHEDDLVTVVQWCGHIQTRRASWFIWERTLQTTRILRWLHGDLHGNVRPTYEPNTDGWIAWYGGDCPIEADQGVQLISRVGQLWQGPAGNFNWSVGYWDYRLIDLPSNTKTVYLAFSELSNPRITRDGSLTYRSRNKMDYRQPCKPDKPLIVVWGGY